MITRFTNKI